MGPPLALEAWCQACLGWLQEGELHYPAIASIGGALNISNGERILIVNGGRCRMAVGWALLWPDALFSCLESCQQRHCTASATVSQLAGSVSNRISLLHCDDPFK